MANNDSNPDKGFDNTSYLNLLKKKDGVIDSIKKSMNSLNKTNIIYVQDNAPLHMKINRETNIPYVFELLKSHKLDYVDNWPALSPDLNPIEKMWSLTQQELDKLLIKTKPKNERQLFTLIRKAWDNVENEKAIKIYSTFLSTCQIVLDHKGHNNFRG